MENTVNKINNIASEYIFLEFSIFSYKSGILIIAASEDFSYYHNFEIHFENVFAIIGNVNWKVDTQKDIIKIISTTNEGITLNKKYKIEKGFSIFRFVSEDELINYIVAENISFKNEVVKYNYT